MGPGPNDIGGAWPGDEPDGSGAADEKGASDAKGPSGPSMSQDDRDALAVLLTVHGLGPLTLARLVAALGSPAAIVSTGNAPNAAARLIAASLDADGSTRRMPREVATAIVEAAAARERIIAAVARANVRVVVQSDEEYPARLLQIEVPPPALFVRGSLAPLAAEHVVAVVGTRRPSPGGRRIASRIATALARAGATVVSGLAVGVDGAAHAACVTDRAPTIAFIGGGHAVLFPKAHDRLADAIVDGGGAVISEYAPHTLPSRGTFPQRNRLISGASDAVVVVEAGARSGALVTASWALEQGRECFVVPGSIDAPTSAGCNGFLRDWPGLARIVSGVPQLLDDLGLMGAAALPGAGEENATTSGVGIRSTVRMPTAAAVLSGRDAAQQSTADAILRGATTVDEIVATTGLTVAAVLGALTRLETSGLVRGFLGRYEAMGPLAAVTPDQQSAAA